MENIDWSNEFEESLIMSSSNGVAYNNNNKNNGTSSSSLSSQEIQKTELFPNFFPRWNSRSGAGSSWGVAVNAGTSRSSIEYSRPPALNTVDPLQNCSLPILDCGISNSNALDHQQQQQQMKKPAAIATNTTTTTTTASFESSLDCLLSASTSLTDTTATSADQDDGISLIFSDCKNLWNFASTAKINLDTVNSQNSEEIIINQSNGNKRKRGGISENLDFQSVDHQAGSSKKGRLMEKHPVTSSSNINFQQASSSASSADEPDAEAIAQMKEIIYRAAAFRPVSFGEEAAEKPKRKNVRISKDPQTVAARQRRERISERIRVLQKLVPGGSKMDTASMLDEAANYLKFLRSQVKALEANGHNNIDPTVNIFPPNTNLAFSPFLNYSFAMHQPQFSIHNPNPVHQSKS